MRRDVSEIINLLIFPSFIDRSQTDSVGENCTRTKLKSNNTNTNTNTPLEPFDRASTRLVKWRKINVMPARTSNTNSNESTTQQSQCNTPDKTQPCQENKAEREEGRTVYLSDRSHDMQEKSKTHPHLLISSHIYKFFLFFFGMHHPHPHSFIIKVCILPNSPSSAPLPPLHASQSFHYDQTSSWYWLALLMLLTISSAFFLSTPLCSVIIWPRISLTSRAMFAASPQT
jgi:hypothetical protein